MVVVILRCELCDALASLSSASLEGWSTTVRAAILRDAGEQRAPQDDGGARRIVLNRNESTRPLACHVLPL